MDGDQAEEQSLEERMLNVLNAEDEEPKEEVEAEASEEPTEESEEEVEAEESDEDEPSATIKLKVNGEEIEKPLEEVISLAQQGIDYTQKTQKVAEERRQLDEYAQTIKVQEQNFNEYVQVQNALVNDIAKIVAVDEQLAAYQNVNWDAYADSDPVEAQKLFFKYNQLQTQKVQLESVLANKQQQLEYAKAQRTQELVRQNKEALAKEIPNWNDSMARDIYLSSKEYGFTDTELNAITDHRVGKVLYDAMQWRKLQANPTTKQKISQAKPIVKPGANDTKQQASSQSRVMREQLRKTGDGNLAQKLIERML
jgi:chemotaxis protein histidine kinase CheA